MELALDTVQVLSTGAQAGNLTRIAANDDSYATVQNQMEQSCCHRKPPVLLAALSQP